MRTFTKRIAAPLAIVISLSLAPALSGCSVNDIIKGASGGNVQLPGASVPADFPSEVPLLNNNVTYGLAIGKGSKKVWSVILKVDGASAIDDITTQLEAAGFTKETSYGGSTEDGATFAFSNDTYGVIVITAKDKKEGWIASYTVAPKGS
ncbi:MAG: hypothetical protein EPN91_06870 [Salinibacterium sp.]|nr:MAG: hypothetical protein EPN91_06870 [Salinibacterium sp.]